MIVFFQNWTKINSFGKMFPKRKEYSKYRISEKEHRLRPMREVDDEANEMAVEREVDMRKRL